MKTWTLRLGLSLMIAVGFWPSQLPAQQYTIPPVQEVLVVPTVPYEPAYHPYVPPAFMPAPQPQPANHFLQRSLNSHGLCCQANHPYGCCGNFHSEMRWIFGSCREFFQERCEPNPSHAEKRGQR